MQKVENIDETPAFAKHVLPAVPSSEVYLEDCVKALKRFNDNHFDLAIVDPPYGINISSAGGYYHVKGKGQANPHTKKDWDSGIPTAEYWDELFRVSKNQIVWGGNYMTEFLSPSRCWIFWDKMQHGLTMSDCELAYSSFDYPTRVWCKNRCVLKEQKTIHPTEKPTDLYDWILANYSFRGAKIIDTHLGSGSIALAIDKANKLDNMNLEFVGIELDTEYFNAAVNRFRLAHAQNCLSF